MKTLLIQAWMIHHKDNTNYLPYTHWVYLNEIVKYYDRIYLLSPIKEYSSVDEIESTCIPITLQNISVIPLPYSEGYASAIKSFFAYRKIYANLSAFDITHVYLRFPVPFGWLAKIYLKQCTRIIHFVGDPIDTIKANMNIGKLKKRLIITSFLPEYKMYLWACKGASVYTNGYHIANKLKTSNILATPVISTTLNQNDFSFEEEKIISNTTPSIIYVGYLRKAKGVETVIESFKLFQTKYPGALLTIVGTGESESELKTFVQKQEIKNISFTGHIDDRATLNEMLRNHDIFCFASLSEGSPRVILEAMANGINVVSTPVGALPYVFQDNEDILFAGFNNAVEFADKLIALVENPTLSQKLQKNAFQKVRNFTIDNFLKNIFYEA